MSENAPSCTIPSQVNGHTDVKLTRVLTESVKTFAVNHNPKHLGILVFGIDSSTLVVYNLDIFWLLKADVLLKFLDALFCPFNLPEVLGLSGLDLEPVDTFVVGGTEFLHNVSGKTKG
jgi:hypothetical protein